MARSREDPLAEFHRLCDCFDSMDDCAYLGHNDPERMGGARLGPLPRARILAAIAAKTATPGQCVAGVRDALNDMSLGIAEMLQYDPDRAHGILSKYAARTGSDFFSDAGNPEKLVKAYLRRGRLNDQNEYRMIASFLREVDRGTLSETDRKKGQALMEAYESGVSP